MLVCVHCLNNSDTAFKILSNSTTEYLENGAQNYEEQLSVKTLDSLVTGLANLCS